jgi:hypothetical protein
VIANQKLIALETIVPHIKGDRSVSRHAAQARAQAVASTSKNLSIYHH